MEEKFKKIGQLLRGNPDELYSYLRLITKEIEIGETKSKVYYHMLKFNGNKEPRVKDLTVYLSSLAIDYAIPRSQILNAQERDKKENTTRHIRELSKKTTKLFTSLKKTGEGGEMLLYVFAQYVLRVPQILCKMNLKTDGALHFQGTDGLHLKYDREINELILYWGESKIYADLDSAMRDCFDSIKPYLLREEESERDIELFRDNLDLLDEELEDAIIEYLDPDSVKFGRLVFQGICLIGFDEEAYPLKPNSVSENDVCAEIENKISDWNEKIRKKLLKRSPLETYKMDIFLVPFPSVEKFRQIFLEEIKNA